jgi:F-type H+-transporting ATPase subunit alpha
MRGNHPEILAEIREKKILSDELIDTLKKVVQEYAGEFAAAFSVKQSA